MDVVVIISDTLRRDHLGCYGNKWIRTPQLDRFAKHCVVMDRAYPASFPTMPMRADLMTGKFTLTYLGWAPLPAEEIVLQQLFGEAGYHTAAKVDTPFYVRRGFGYDRGFHSFEEIRGQHPAERAEVNYERRHEEDYYAPMTCAAAERWIERHHHEKSFLYVDTWDPHEPWDPPEYYTRMYHPRWDGTPAIAPVYDYVKARGVTPEQLRTVRAAYAGEVTMVDRAVGRLIERIASLGLMDKTIIVFTADHGFHFGEHGLFGKMIWEKRSGAWKAAPLYEEVTRVPLLIYVPGVKPCRSSAIVMAPDLMPTILDLAGLKVPDTVQGKSYARVVRGQDRKIRDFAVTTIPLYNPGHVTHVVDGNERRVPAYLASTISSGPWTMLYRCSGLPVELYDLRSDPRQRRNVARKHPEICKKLHRQFYSLIEPYTPDPALLEPRSSL